MPTCNRRHSIDRAITSVLAQTLPAAELIIVDDGSTDGTAQHVARTYRQVRLIRHDRNYGAASARNTAISAARHEHLAFLDSDDAWRDTYLASIAGAWMQNPDASLVYTHYDIVEGLNGAPIRPAFPKSDGDQIAAMLLNCFIQTCSVMSTRRSLVLSVGGFDPAYRIAEDMAMYLRLLPHGPAIGLADCLVRRHITDDNLVNDSTLWWSSCCRLVSAFLAEPACARYRHLEDSFRANLWRVIQIHQRSVERAKTETVSVIAADDRRTRDGCSSGRIAGQKAPGDEVARWLNGAGKNATGLISYIGHNDADILPFFLEHYRRLGISKFLLTLHGPWDERALNWLEQQHDVSIWDRVSGPFDDPDKCSTLTSMAAAFRGRWIVVADADEFLELPCTSLRRTILTLEVLGLDLLPAYLLQRLRADGALAALNAGQSIEQQFPCFNFNLCEDMGNATPVWKSKYPLARVTEDFGIERGNHWPPTRMPFDHAPIRAIVHHYKWRAALRVGVGMHRGPGSAPEQTATYRSWLENNAGKLPTSNAKLYARTDMIARGLLVKPSRRHLLIGGLKRRLRRASQQGSEDRARLQRRLERLGTPWSHEVGHLTCTDRLPSLDKLLNRSGRICLVSPELSPPLMSTGVGTAIAALADHLIAAGHEVHLLFCPHSDQRELWDVWYSYWQNRGARLEYMPCSQKAAELGPRHQNQLLRIARYLADHQFDVVHCPDIAGIARSLAILRASGPASRRTRIVVTTHGGSVGKHRSDPSLRSRGEEQGTASEDPLLSLADLICCPGNGMREKLVSSRPALAEKIVVLPNGLSSETRSYGVARRSSKTVDEIVMFGQLESEKRLAGFLAAIKSLVERGVRGFAVTFLGRLGSHISAATFRDPLGDLGLSPTFIENYDHVEAINYLKTRHCLVVMASPHEHPPHGLSECLENHIPVLASPLDELAELVACEDRRRILVADDHDRLVETLANALVNGMRPASLAFEPSVVGLYLAAIHGQLVEEARTPSELADPTGRSTA